MPLVSSSSINSQGSSGNPVSDRALGGMGIQPINTTETTLLDLARGAQKVNLGFTNVSGGAVSVTVYMKLVSAGVAAAAAAGNTLVHQYALPTTGVPFQVLENFVVPAGYILTALLSTGAASAANAWVTGEAQR